MFKECMREVKEADKDNYSSDEPDIALSVPDLGGDATPSTELFRE